MIKRVSLNPVLKKLQQSGFYWGSITAVEAKSLLRDKAVGKFLVRDSSDPRHLFTITLVTSTGITNVRIIFCESLFSLDKEESVTWQRNGAESKEQSTPRFDCVVKMIFYYMLSSRMVLQKKEQLDNFATGSKFLLLSPLYKGVSSLQHLCRRTLNRQPFIRECQNALTPDPVKSYLSSYPYPIWNNSQPTITTADFCRYSSRHFVKTSGKCFLANIFEILHSAD